MLASINDLFLLWTKSSGWPGLDPGVPQATRETMFSTALGRPGSGSTSVLRNSYVYDQSEFDQEDLWADVVASVSSHSEGSNEIMDSAVPIMTRVDHPYSIDLPAFYMVEDPALHTTMLMFLVTFVQTRERVVVRQAGFLHARDPRYVYGKIALPGSRAFVDGPIVQRPTLIVPFEHLIDDETKAQERAAALPMEAEDAAACVPEAADQLVAEPDYWLIPQDPARVSGLVNLSSISSMVYLRCKHLVTARQRVRSTQGLYCYMQGAKLASAKNDVAAQLVLACVLAMASESCDNDLDIIVEFEARILEGQAGDPMQKRMILAQNGVDCSALLSGSDMCSATLLRRELRQRYLELIRRARGLWKYDKPSGLTRVRMDPIPADLDMLVRRGIVALEHLVEQASVAAMQSKTAVA